MEYFVVLWYNLLISRIAEIIRKEINNET